MDEKNLKNFISFLMDLSDLAEKAKQEMRGIMVSGRMLNEQEHEAIQELVLGAISDLEIVDSDINGYMRFGKEKFAVLHQ